MQPSPSLQETIKTFQNMGYPADALKFDPTLVRGLDYYTGIILEVVLKADSNSSSLAGGGRYDKIIGQFSGVDMPANGFSIGFDRTIEVLEQNNLLGSILTTSQVMITFNSPTFEAKALSILAQLRKAEINTEIWLDPNTKLEKQLKYTDTKGIRFAVIIGLVETEPADEVILKDLQSRTQETVKISDLIEKIMLNKPI